MQHIKLMGCSLTVTYRGICSSIIPEKGKRWKINELHFHRKLVKEQQNPGNRKL